MKRLPPLAQRLHVDFSGEAKWDNPRHVQVRLFLDISIDEQELRLEERAAAAGKTPDDIEIRL